MIKSIQFKNFKVLRDCTLPLGQFTLLVGPNGSGKSTVFQALDLASKGRPLERRSISVTHRNVGSAELGCIFTWSDTSGEREVGRIGTISDSVSLDEVPPALRQARVYSLDADAISAQVQLQPKMSLTGNGKGLAGVLDRLRDEHPERWESLNEQLGTWLPEFDHILFDTPAPGDRAVVLRTRRGGHKISASDLSQGTLLALTILTLAYLPEPPTIVGFEEPDRGIHPRLLRDVRDALYRLAYPESAGESRAPVQVIATTHSPYMLDLFKEQPEEIVIAQKLEDNVHFQRLSDLPNVDEILEGAPLEEM